jgi:peptide-methionine (S)-S-oxide reductase
MTHPTYEQVCTGTTGHVEAVQLEFDPSIISYETLLNVFFSTHDPTSLDRQGSDVGAQYRSVVFYHNPGQREETERIIKKFLDEKTFDRPIVTQVKPLTDFYPAEDYHRDYFAKNPGLPYCQAVINPKLAKLREKFLPLLKP